MSDSPAAHDSRETPSPVKQAVEGVGALAADQLQQGAGLIRSIGGMAALFAEIMAWCFRGFFRPGVRLSRAALTTQMVRVGVDSIGIVIIVEFFIGSILALQLAPVLASYGQIDQVAVVIAIAVVRELGPLLTGIVLSGYAGASIAAELGAMVEAEEIKALRAHALDPIRFLIVPRFLATTVMIVGLTVIADIVGVLGGCLTSWAVLGVSPQVYVDITQTALVVEDFITGLVKAGVFGMLIATIACYQGLNVSGGAVGVGKATTATVVQCIVAIIGMDAAFTAVFYTFGL
ncbi:MAG: ABC transporter permease [Planctomycetes bacterium]|nr:ABC transporter permease [Planctomycetota bacterium]